MRSAPAQDQLDVGWRMLIARSLAGKRVKGTVKPLKGRFVGAHRYRVGDLGMVYTACSIIDPLERRSPGPSP